MTVVPFAGKCKEEAFLDRYQLSAVYKDIPDLLFLQRSVYRLPFNDLKDFGNIVRNVLH